MRRTIINLACAIASLLAAPQAQASARRCENRNWAQFYLRVTGPSSIRIRVGSGWRRVASCQVAYAVASETEQVSGPRHWRQDIFERHLNGIAFVDFGVWTVRAALINLSPQPYLEVTARRGRLTVRYDLT